MLEKGGVSLGSQWHGEPLLYILSKRRPPDLIHTPLAGWHYASV